MIESHEPESWGWKPDFYATWHQALEGLERAGELAPAKVTARERGRYEVVCPDFRRRSGIGGVLDIRGALDSPGAGARPATPGAETPLGPYRGIEVGGRFAIVAGDDTEYPAVGDWVVLDRSDGLRIRAVLPRRSALRRGKAGRTSEEQVLAANVDTLLIVLALDGDRGFVTGLIERGLVVARASGAAACVVLNKADRRSPEELAAIEAEASRVAGAVPVFPLSAKTGDGMSALCAFLSPGETVGMIGKSGVGKSSLVNALSGTGSGSGNAEGIWDSRASALPSTEASAIFPTAVEQGPAREGEVGQADDRGRHTTTSSRLYRLSSGILLIDGPGVRELKLWGGAEGMAGAFPDIAELAEGCRFSDCSHSGEPGCAVRAALDSGRLDEDRFNDYLELEKERLWFERRHDQRAARAAEARWKGIAKLRKELKQARR